MHLILVWIFALSISRNHAVKAYWKYVLVSSSNYSYREFTLKVRCEQSVLKQHFIKSTPTSTSVRSSERKSVCLSVCQQDKGTAVGRKFKNNLKKWFSKNVHSTNHWSLSSVNTGAFCLPQSRNSLLKPKRTSWRSGRILHRLVSACMCVHIV